MNCSLFRALALASLLAVPLPAAERMTTATNLLERASSHYAKLDTNRIHYVSLGIGKETLVFVHGWSCNLDFWRFQLPALQDKAQLILIDLPGHGQSDKPQLAYTIDFFARAVDAVMRDAKVERATLLGHSLGTPIICRFYRHHPEKTAALVAVDGALRGFNPSPEQKEQFIAPYRSPQYREAAEKFVDSMFPFDGTEALRARAKAAMLQTPQYVMASALENMFDNAAWEPKQIDVLLLVLNARNPLWSADYEAHVRKIAPQVDYRVMEGVGHFLMQEKPAEFNAMLLDFLQKQSLVKK
jgi:sigma-B regulation protein RsbQ